MTNTPVNKTNRIEHLTVIMIVGGFLFYWLGFPSGTWFASTGFLISAFVFLIRELKAKSSFDVSKALRVFMLLSMVIWIIVNFLFFEGGSLFFALIILLIYTILKKRELAKKYERTSD